jgi:hypothetical protein
MCWVTLADRCREAILRYAEARRGGSASVAVLDQSDCALIVTVLVPPHQLANATRLSHHAVRRRLAWALP